MVLTTRRARAISSPETTGWTLERWFARGHRFENGALLDAVRVADDDLHHETVHLRFGQRIRAFLLQRVLRGEHEEWIGQFVGRLAEGYLAFLHGFEQRALHLGRSAVDFIGQNEIAENRAVLGAEAAVLRIVNHRAHDVGGQHVRRELNTLEAEVDASGEGFERERFCQAGHAFEQDVAVGDERNEQAVDQMLLADNHAPHLLLQRAHPRRSLLHRIMHRLNGRVRPGVRRNRFGHWHWRESEGWVAGWVGIGRRRRQRHSWLAWERAAWRWRHRGPELEESIYYCFSYSLSSFALFYFHGITSTPLCSVSN